MALPACGSTGLENNIIKLAQGNDLRVYAGYREETYRLIVHYGNRFGDKEMPWTKTIYPDGTQENFQIKHGEERALLAYTYTQEISRNKVTPDCREFLCRGNETRFAFVQLWPGKINKSFWEKFDTIVQWKVGDDQGRIEDELRKHPSVEVQAVRDSMEVTRKLFGKLFKDDAESLPCMLVRTKQEELNSDLVFEGEACQIRAFLQACSCDELNFLHICSVTDSGFESVKHGCAGETAGNKHINLKNTLEGTVCYMREARPERFRNAISSMEFYRGRSCLHPFGTEEVVRSWHLPLADLCMQGETMTPAEERIHQRDGEPSCEPGPGRDVLEGLDLLKVIGTGGCAVVVLARGHRGNNYAVKLQHMTHLPPEHSAVLSRELDTIKHLKEGLRRYQQEQNHAFPFLISMVVEFRLSKPLADKRTLLGHSIIEDTHGKTTFDMVLVMGYAEGGSLHEEIVRHTRSTGLHPREHRLGELRLYLAEIVAAMHFLHGARVAHRDLSPKNVLLMSGHVKVADFGLSKRVDVTTADTAVGGACPAPELFDGAPYTEKCDVFSYGVIFEYVLDLKRALSGQRPRDDFDNEALLLCKQCVQKLPEQRPSFADLKNHGFFETVPIRTTHTGKFTPFFTEIIKGGEVDWSRLESEAAQVHERVS